MIISFASTKGGVGKSTLACNFAVEGRRAGKRVLLVDADVQGSSMGFRSMREKDDIKATAITTPTLHKDLPDFQDKFDLIVIDAGGRETHVFRSAIVAADTVVVPILPSQYDIWAASDTLGVLKEACVYKDIKTYFLFNQVIQGTRITGEAMDALKEVVGENGIRLLDTMLYSRVAYKNSIGRGLGVVEFEPNGKAAGEIQALYKEVTEG